AVTTKEDRRKRIIVSDLSARYAARRVLITGGGSGIGQACVLRILAEGGRVAAADISPSGLRDTVNRAGAAAERLTTVTMDVADEQSVRHGVGQAITALGGLDALVNAAGILRSAHLVQTTLADFEQVRSEEHTSELQSRENLVCR